jgi:hypothetical protein
VQWFWPCVIFLTELDLAYFPWPFPVPLILYCFM